MIKKILKTIGIILLVLIALIALFLFYMNHRQIISRNYTTDTPTGGDIEAKYLAMGSHEVSSMNVRRDDSLKKILVFYPSDLKESEHPYPVVVYSNGTGQKGSQYKNLYRHLASWGFIVLANDDPESWSGLPSELTLDWILEEDGKPNSVFYGKVDYDNIGTYGHSQGGAAVFHTICDHEHSDLYKAAAALSPTHEELAGALGWHFDLNAVKIPVFLLAGTEGEFEIETVIPYEKYNLLYDHLNVQKACARKTGAQHGTTVFEGDGYVTAWFMWQLQGDEEAAKAFTGNDPELLRNPRYQDQRIDID